MAVSQKSRSLSYTPCSEASRSAPSSSAVVPLFVILEYSSPAPSLNVTFVLPVDSVFSYNIILGEKIINSELHMLTILIEEVSS